MLIYKIKIEINEIYVKKKDWNNPVVTGVTNESKNTEKINTIGPSCIKVNKNINGIKYHLFRKIKVTKNRIKKKGKLNFIVTYDYFTYM